MPRSRVSRVVRQRAVRCLGCVGALLLASSHASAQEPATAPPAQVDFLKSPELSGDWGGQRSKLLQKGTKIEASLTQFFDWVPVGDDNRGFDYGGKVDVKVNSQLGKYLWEGFSAAGHFEL